MIPSDLRAHFSWIPTWNNHVGGSRFYQLTQKTTSLTSDQPNITACEPFVQFELDRRPGACHGTHVVPFFYECTSTVLRTKWYHSFTSGLHSDHICEVVPRSHQCGDLRHLSKCSAHFLQHCFREKILFGDSTVGTPGRQPTMPEVPPTGTRSTGYSDIQNSVVQIVRNSEHTSFSVKVLRPVRNKSLLPAIQVTTSHI